MIKSIKNIRNFKSIESLSSVDLAPVTLISGVNNCGKTNLLEAIFLYHDRLNPEMTLRLFSFRGISNIMVNPESVFAPIFTNFDMNREICIQFNRKGVSEELKIKSVKEYSPRPIPTNKINDGLNKLNHDSFNSYQPSFALQFEYEISGQRREKSFLHLSNTNLGIDAEFVKPLNVSVHYMGARTRVSSKEDSIRFGQLDLIGKQNIIVDILKIIDKRITSLTTIAVGENSVIHADLGIGRKIPINYLGDGISRILSIALSIANNKYGIVLIDEIENGIHYSVLPQLWTAIGKLSEEFECQIISTTHSYECIQAAYKGFVDDAPEMFKFIRLDRSKDSKHDAKIFDIDMLKTAFKQGWEVR